jgi:parvulin-like peptidyl-prolyl isomerase
VIRKLALVCALLAACASSGEVAARVNGEPIYVADVTELRPEAVIESAEFRQDLFRLVATEALVQKAEADYGVEVTQDQVGPKVEELEEQIEAQGGTVEEFLEAQGVTRALLERVALEQAVREAIDEELSAEQAEPTPAELDQAYQTGLPGLVTVCARHILVTTQEEADQVKSRLSEGEDFAAVAEEVSLDQASEGGELGCTSPASFVPEFAEALMTGSIGELIGPVQTQFGFHIIEVKSREQPVLEEVRDQLVAQLRQQRQGAAFQAFLDEALAQAEVEVDSRYGTWSTDPVPQILAPAETE